MARILYVATHATDDPTRAGLAFIAANGAKDAGHDPVVALLGEGTYLIKGDIPRSITPVGFPPLSDIMATTISNAAPIYV